jgi:hypothetical protein
MAINLLVIGFSENPDKRLATSYLDYIPAYRRCAVGGHVSEYQWEAREYKASYMVIEDDDYNDTDNLYVIWLMTAQEQVHPGTLLLQKAIAMGLTDWSTGRWGFVTQRHDMTVATIEKACAAILSTAILSDAKEMQVCIEAAYHVLKTEERLGVQSPPAE